MNYTYEEIKGDLGDITILRSDGACIPTDPANADYQAYLDKDTLPSNSADPVEAEKSKK